MDIYFTTSTGPLWIFSFIDKLNNVLNLTGASFTMNFRSTATGNKTQGNGTFSGSSQQLTAGQVTYQLANNDLANTYVKDSAWPGIITVEILVEATIGTEVYDAMNPPMIQIRKI